MKRHSSHLAMLASAGLWLTLGHVAAAQAQLLINELDYDQPGADDAEFIELKNGGESAVDPAGHSLALVNGNDGAVYRTIALPATRLPAGAFFVICGNPANVPNCDLDASPDSDLIQNGAPDALSLRLLDATIDRLSYEGEVPDHVEGMPAEADSGTIAGQALARCPDGTDSGNNALDFKLRSITPGLANDCSIPSGPLGACGDPTTSIAQIQGTGAASPIQGETVAIEAVVVGDFQDTDLNGVFLQQADTQTDADPLSSEGIFVYEGAVDVAVADGDLVRVRGRVVEFDGLTELGEISGMRVCARDMRVSTLALTLPLASADALESLEGMRVEIPQQLTVTGNYELGRYGTLLLASGGRLQQPTHVALPGAAALAVQAENARRTIQLDDVGTKQNPDPIPYLDPSRTRRTGDTLSGLTGVVDARFGAYRIQPSVAPVFAAANAREPEPEVDGRLRVASFNVLNFFTTLDDGEPHCGPTARLDCRGANTPAEFDRQRQKLLSALTRLDADLIGLLEIENNPSAALASLAEGLNLAQGADTYAFVDTGTLGTDAIKVALLYRPAVVEPIGPFAVLDSSVDRRFLDTKHRPVLAQTFKERASDARFTLALNHWKSKGSGCEDIGDPDLGDGAGNCNATRVAAARAIVDWLATDPTASGDPDRLIIGDLNSYAREEPIAQLIAGGYTSLVGSLAGPDAYSYQFAGQFGYLDHALSSSSMLAQVRGVAEWHINSDEPIVLDYNTENRSDDPFDASSPFRASDHDPIVIGLDLTPPTAAEPPAQQAPRLSHWPPVLFFAGCALLALFAAFGG